MDLVKTIAHAGVAVTLLLQAAYFGWVGYVTALPFIEASFGIPQFAIYDLGLSLLLAALAIGYWMKYKPVTALLHFSWPLHILYGAWVFFNGHSMVARWSGIFEGDLVALGVSSGVGFIGLGLLLLIAWRVSSQS
jgi:hypothetical protein